MRLLIDTNILIHLEDNKVIDQQFALFYQMVVSNKHSLYYHSACIEDLRRDKDVERQEITLSKLRKYSVMPNPGIPDEDFVEKVGQKKENDRIDNIQLFQVKKGYIDYFITEDKRIRDKALKVNLKERVLSIEEGLEMLKENTH